MPGLGATAVAAKRLVERRRFPGSQAYWEQHYRSGGDSGPGSRGVLAQYKAEFVNAFVERHDIESVAELGCGDGSQLALARYPAYVGLDVRRRPRCGSASGPLPMTTARRSCPTPPARSPTHAVCFGRTWPCRST